MEALAKIAGITGLVFVLVIFGTLLGAFGGWAVGLVFSDTILGTLARFGVDTAGLTMWQLGAMLGFFGGFFRVGIKSENA